ncbi:MAG: YDG domain-containing protein, partial [Prevotella sp.]|nr:YDG domain-containing protein [Prevotella sp.]
LYDLVTGQKNATYADVLTAAENVTNAADMRTYNDDNDIKVTFGGYQWYAVYLSTTMDGRPILTLYLVNPLDDLKSKFAYSSSTMGTDIATSEYPSSMYGVSVVRTIALNNGGLCRQGDDAHANEVAKNENHQLAALTISTQPGNYCAAIITPSEVEWQKNGYNYTAEYLRPNEGWGKVTDGNWYYFNSYFYGSMNITGKTHYADWQNDTLWLPSAYELAADGVWQLSDDQRSSSANSWTRSSSVTGIDRAVALTTTGEFCEVDEDVNSGGLVRHELSVRPALHIDLSATALMADWDETPSDVTVTYNALNQTIEQMHNQPSWYRDTMTITYTQNGNPVTAIKDAGEYTATVQLSDMTKVITLTVVPQNITVHGIQVNDKTYDRTQNATFNLDDLELTGKYHIDDLSVSCSGRFADKTVGDAKPVVTTVTLTGNAAHNYVLTNPELTLTANITPKTVFIEGIAADNKVYDHTNRANLTTSGVNLALGGMYAGDDLTLSATGTYNQVNVGNNLPITLDIHLVGDDATNYKIDESSQKTTTGNIQPRVITVTADNQTVKFGDPLNLTARVTSGSLANGDPADKVYTLSLVIPEDTILTDDHLPVGEYAIKGTIADDETAHNYTITFLNALYTVLSAEEFDVMQPQSTPEDDGNSWQTVLIVTAVAAAIGALVGVGLVVRTYSTRRDTKKESKKDTKKATDKKSTDKQPEKNIAK